ncbi:MAG TPA: hypothetical protein VFZ56_04490 [Gemmatimonadaceae bacterium]
MIERPKSEMKRVSLTRLLLWTCAICMLTPAAAHAYIDPLSGSLVLQAVLAGVLGAAMTMGRIGSMMRDALGRFWRRLTG